MHLPRIIQFESRSSSLRSLFHTIFVLNSNIQIPALCSTLMYLRCSTGTLFGQHRAEQGPEISEQGLGSDTIRGRQRQSGAELQPSDVPQIGLGEASDDPGPVSRQQVARGGRGFLCLQRKPVQSSDSASQTSGSQTLTAGAPASGVQTSAAASADIRDRQTAFGDRRRERELRLTISR